MKKLVLVCFLLLYGCKETHAKTQTEALEVFFETEDYEGSVCTIVAADLVKEGFVMLSVIDDVKEQVKSKLRQNTVGILSIQKTRGKCFMGTSKIMLLKVRK